MLILYCQRCCFETTPFAAFAFTKFPKAWRYALCFLISLYGFFFSLCTNNVKRYRKTDACLLHLQTHQLLQRGKILTFVGQTQLSHYRNITSRGVSFWRCRPAVGCGCHFFSPLSEELRATIFAAVSNSTDTEDYDSAYCRSYASDEDSCSHLYSVVAKSDPDLQQCTADRLDLPDLSRVQKGMLFYSPSKTDGGRWSMSLRQKEE